MFPHQEPNNGMIIGNASKTQGYENNNYNNNYTNNYSDVYLNHNNNNYDYNNTNNTGGSNNNSGNGGRASGNAGSGSTARSAAGATARGTYAVASRTKQCLCFTISIPGKVGKLVAIIGMCSIAVFIYLGVTRFQEIMDSLPTFG
jgi:hypothetical protein